MSRDVWERIPDDWYEWVTDEWKEKLEALGFRNPEIQFSGFGSQGDGASFTADAVERNWRRLMPRAVKRAIKAAEVTHRLIGEPVPWDKDWSIAVAIERGSEHRYVHEYTTGTQIDGCGSPDLPEVGTWLNDLEKALDEEVRGLARKIYRDLEKTYFAEYDYYRQEAEAEEEAP